MVITCIERRIESLFDESVINFHYIFSRSFHSSSDKHTLHSLICYKEITKSNCINENFAKFVSVHFKFILFALSKFVSVYIKFILLTR